MNILLISSLIVITIQQCQENGVSLFNNQLRSGLLPTYLFPEAIDPALAVIQSFPQTINVSSNGWKLSTDNFVSQALISDQIYQSLSKNQITVSNPTIKVEVAFNFNNGSIKNGQGIAILNSNCNASYTFQINEKTNGYSFSLINSQINFLIANFSVVYANFPYQNGQLTEILETLNTNTLIQQALNTYYNANPKSNIQTFLQKKLSSFPIIKGENSTKTYTYGKGTSKQTFTYTVNISSINIVYTPYIYYQAQAEMNIENLKTPYTCQYPINYTIPIPNNISNIEVISVDVISNSFMYAFNSGYFKTTLNAQTWKVPFFSWTTGGLNNIMTSVYTSYYYSSQIGGSCSAINASYVGWNPKTINFDLAFNCSLSYTINNILNFQVQMPNVEVAIEFSRTSATSYFKILQVINPIITLYPVTNYTIDDPYTVKWFINEGIQNSFVGSKFYEGVFDSQRDIKSEDITYNIMNGIITITNIK